jgi:hypothetical protein
MTSLIISFTSEPRSFSDESASSVVTWKVLPTPVDICPSISSKSGEFLAVDNSLLSYLAKSQFLTTIKRAIKIENC